MKIRGWEKFKRILRRIALPFIAALAVFLFLITPLVFLYQNEPEAFTEYAYFTVATIAAVFAGVSTYIASRVLQMTRATQRPFLNILVSVNRRNQGNLLLDIYIHNKGVFPADRISVECIASNVSKRTKAYALSPEKEEYPICFPGEDLEPCCEIPYGRNPLYLDDENEIKVKVTVKYRNKLTQGEHKTSMVYLEQCNSQIFGKWLSPLPEESDWE